MKTILFLLINLLTLGAMATDGVMVKGKIRSVNEPSIPYATVKLVNLSDSSAQVTQSDLNGEFIFSPVKPGHYQVEATYLGHETFIINQVEVKEGEHNLELNNITLKPSSELLKEAVITAEFNQIENKAGKTIVNVEQSNLYNGNNLSEILEKTPGIKVSESGNVSINGKPGAVIMIDGKPASYNQNDLQNILKSIQANNIQRIEISGTPSSKYDAAGNSGIINIITKKNRVDGLNGSITANVAQGFYTKALNAYSLDIKQGKFNINANYSIAKRKGFSNMDLKRSIVNQDQTQHTIYSNTYVFFPMLNHVPRLGLEYNINKKLTFSSSLSALLFNIKPEVKSKVGFKSSDLLNDIEMNSLSNEKWGNVSFSNELRYMPDSSGKQLSASIDYAKYAHQTELNQSFISLYDKSYNANLYANQSGELNLTAFKTDFTLPLNQSSKIETGAKSSFVTSSNNNEFYNGINRNSPINKNRTNYFEYYENINALYLTYNTQRDKLSFEGGARTEHTHVKGLQKITGERFERNYIQLFPTASLSYRLNKKNEISWSAGRRIIRPDYRALNPYQYSVDAVSFDRGNPNLKPRISINSELTYNFNQKILLTASVLSAKDYISQVIYNIGNRNTLQTFENSCNYLHYSFMLTYQFKLFNVLNNSFNPVVYMQKINPYTAFNIPGQQLVSYTLSANHSLSLKHNISIDVSEIYNSKYLEGFTVMRNTLNVSMGARKSFKNNKGSVGINVSDLFYTLLQGGVVYNNGVTEDWLNYRDTRVVSLNLIYKFGHGKTIKLRRNSGIDSEKERIGL